MDEWEANWIAERCEGTAKLNPDGEWRVEREATAYCTFCYDGERITLNTVATGTPISTVGLASMAIVHSDLNIAAERFKAARDHIGEIRLLRAQVKIVQDAIRVLVPEGTPLPDATWK